MSDDSLEDASMFYEYGEHAVTGSGADRWFKVSPELVKFLQNKKIKPKTNSKYNSPYSNK